MMRNWLALISTVYLLTGSVGFASEGISPSQTDDERSTETVVRNKVFYKPGKFELSPTFGVVPFDSIVNHFLVGGRLTWHLSDHFGWEIIDVTLPLPSITDYGRGLITNAGEPLYDVQVNKMKMILGTNLLFSPLYGKIRFFGNIALFFDIYMVAGLGFTNMEVVKLSGDTGSLVENTLKTSWDPGFNFGFGFKLFATNVVGLLVDFRDYFAYSEAYGKKRFASHFGVNVGLSVFVPPF